MYILYLTKKIIIWQYNYANCFYREIKPLMALLLLTIIINHIYYSGLLEHCK